MSKSSYLDKAMIEKNLAIIRERLHRRKNSRLQAEVDFSYKIPGQGSIYHGRSFNISSFGMGFLRDTILSENEQILLHFLLNGEAVVIPGTVTRINGKETSVEFTMSEEEAERFIKLFNREILSEKSTVKISMKEFNKRLE
ncbi:MAG: hypothetical protein CVV50_00525 [Spirochaetae bacterium HGW-Spirochaetae-6]|nr:MAG: hypothetical protein CVV50_00525 [Spirochaetae bacterium HGW-Spirochaetae-6]